MSTYGLFLYAVFVGVGMICIIYSGYVFSLATEGWPEKRPDSGALYGLSKIHALGVFMFMLGGGIAYIHNGMGVTAIFLPFGAGFTLVCSEIGAWMMNEVTRDCKKKKTNHRKDR